MKKRLKCSSLIAFTLSGCLRSVSSSSAITGSSCPYGHSQFATSLNYQPPPSNFALKKIVVVTRHGDRSQITRILGPLYPESEDIAELWKSKLPLHSRLEKLALVSNVETDGLYSGFDSPNIPYGMLTQKGSDQLEQIGLTIKERYARNFLPSSVDEYSSLMYCRSTNMCRTLLSLRSLLLGLIGDRVSQERLPKINFMARSMETMYPQADGACAAIAERRSKVFNDELLHSIPGFAELESKMKRVLGYDNKVNWIVVKEVLTCYEVHDIPLPPNITSEDVRKVTDIAGFIWGTLYKDDVLNRLAVGRFLHELLDDLGHGEAWNPTPASQSGLLIYSGHDSTLVPLLCALGIFDDQWPPYASYLTLEIAEEREGRAAEPANTGIGNGTGPMWVRAIYNDVERPILGNSGVWCRYGDLLTRLRSLAVSRAQYASECAHTDASSAALKETLKQMEEETKATTSK